MKMINQNSQTEAQFIATLQAVNQQLIQEIQERQRVEEALRESSERLKTLINAMPTINFCKKTRTSITVSTVFTRSSCFASILNSVVHLLTGDYMQLI